MKALKLILFGLFLCTTLLSQSLFKIKGTIMYKDSLNYVKAYDGYVLSSYKYQIFNSDKKVKFYIIINKDTIQIKKESFLMIIKK